MPAPPAERGFLDLLVFHIDPLLLGFMLGLCSVNAWRALAFLPVLPILLLIRFPPAYGTGIAESPVTFHADQRLAAGFAEFGGHGCASSSILAPQFGQ